MAAALLACPSRPPSPSAAPPLPAAEQARRIAAAYAAWTEEDTTSADCSVYFAACAEDFERRAGLDPKVPLAESPRAFMKNPDPTWIVGWDRIPEDPGQRHLVFGALTYAAALRTHFHGCSQRFRKVEAARVAQDEAASREIEKARAEPNLYKRLGSLVRLRTELRHELAGTTGVLYALERAIFEEFERSGRRVVYELQHQRSEDVALLRPALSTSEEEDLFCAEGLPAWQDQESVPRDLVKNPLPPERLKALEAKVAAARDLEARIPPAPVALERLDVHARAKPDVLVSVATDAMRIDFAVAKVSRDASGKLVVELTGTSDPFEERECKGEGPTERCSKHTATRHVTIRATMDPEPDFAIQPGDQIAFLGYLLKREITETKKKGGDVALDDRLDMNVFNVLEIWRQQLLVADYFVQ